MIEPFGRILAQHTEEFEALGFNLLYEDDYCAVLDSERGGIALSIEQYITAELLMSFVGRNGEYVPLWMIQLHLDMKSYNRDKHQLSLIKDKFGLRDGSKGREEYARGVKRYAGIYLQQAIRFLGSYHGRFDEEHSSTLYQMPFSHVAHNA